MYNKSLFTNSVLFSNFRFQLNTEIKYGLESNLHGRCINHKKLWKNRAYKTATGFVCDQSPGYQFIVGGW